jgi:hypothetical protein
MKKHLIILFIIITSCASVQDRHLYQTQVIDRADATYENDVLPFIIEQLNHTAASFFYDIDKLNRDLIEQGLPARLDPVLNVIVGNNEIGGVCHDYTSHFIDNYRGLGEIFYVGVDPAGNARLLRRIKQFEKSDIVIENPDNIAVDSSAIDNFYNAVLGEHRNNSREGWAWGWSYGMRGGWAGIEGEWTIGPYLFNSNKNGSLYLIEEIPIPTPLSHAGETDKSKFFNHAWVRIVWRDMTIDVDPTWYDGGRPIEFGAIAEIVPGRINTFPIAYRDFSELSNTRLISPITGVLRYGNNYTFIISSTDYSDFSIVINDSSNDFIKNTETGNFELNLTIPGDIDNINIFGITKSDISWSGVGLIGFMVER